MATNVVAPDHWRITYPGGLVLLKRRDPDKDGVGGLIQIRFQSGVVLPDWIGAEKLHQLASDGLIEKVA